MGHMVRQLRKILLVALSIIARRYDMLSVFTHGEVRITSHPFQSHTELFYYLEEERFIVIVSEVRACDLCTSGYFGHLLKHLDGK